MENLPIDIIKYNIHNFLDLKEKINLLNEIVNICFHQKEYLSFDKTNDKIPLKLLIVIKNYNKNSCKKLLLKKILILKKVTNL